MMQMRFCFLGLLIGLGLQAAEIVPPGAALERSGRPVFTYRTNPRATGTGTLQVQWKDVHGRVVEDRSTPVELTDETDITFKLDLRRAVGMRNTIEARLVFDGKNRKGVADHREESARAEFVAKPAAQRWWDYEIVMWQTHTKDAVAKLKPLGISGGQWNGRNAKLPEFLLENDLRWYAENIATDFYSEYHRYFPDRPVNWRWRAAKEQFQKDPTGKEAFKRHPSLSDERWLKTIHDRLVETTKRLERYRPFFYSLGDESGIADLAAFWDFDFSDESLVPMRLWLRGRYGTLAALNQEWGTSFAEWDQVIPATTNEAMQKPGENYASWADFKDWMDEAFASALKMGNDAVRSVDPHAYVGIGGGQMPGWGGYDYYRISKALTAIEPYNIGNNVEILRSINPDMAVVSVAFARGPWEKHRVWSELLHGNRGLLIWDDKHEFIDTSGAVGSRGKEVAPYYNELRRGVGTLLVNSTRVADKVAIHYSQASMRTEWMRAQKPHGTAWAARDSARERKDSEFLRVRESWCRLVEDLGLQYNFVAYKQVEEGALARDGYKVLILPRSSSLSTLEAEAIRKFVEQGGVVISDNIPGTFNEHSRKLDKSPLADLFARSGPAAGLGKTVLVAGDILNYHQDRLVNKEGPVYSAMAGTMRDAGVRPEFALSAQDGLPLVGVETHTFENGGVRVIGLHTNPQLRVDELGPPEFQKNDRFAATRQLTLTLPAPMEVYDVRAGKHLGRLASLPLKLDPYEPTLYAVSSGVIPKLEVASVARAKRGDTVEVGLRFAGWSPAAKHVVHVEVTDATGKVLPHYSGNVLVEGGSAVKVLPLALNDAPGAWLVRGRDALTGATFEQKLVVE
jgi:hypothetical protein